MNKIQIRHPHKSTPYEVDYAQWCAEQGALLREGRLSDLDRENLAEEIESLGRSDKREIKSRVGVILLHLLKWEFQPQERKPGWLLTLDEQRERVGGLVAESPSLKRAPGEAIAQEYPLARRKAALETGLPLGEFPKECPYPIEKLLSLDFLPGPKWSREANFRD